MTCHMASSGRLEHSFISPLIDKSDSDGVQLNKSCRRVAPAPCPRHWLDNVSGQDQDHGLMPPESSHLLGRKHEFEDEDSAPNEGRIDDWLSGLRSVRGRARSCPPSLDGKASSEIGRGQRPLLDVLQEMSQPQRESIASGSTAFGRTSRSATSQAGYRSVLRNNGIVIDHTGAKLPQELREFLDSSILRQQSTCLTAEEIADAVKAATEIADSAESNVYDLIGTAMLPVRRSDVGCGGSTPWHTDKLPKSADCAIPLAQPKPDIHCGYLTGQRSTWTVRENAVIDHEYAKKITQPARGNCFPFFVVELKSEAMGGTLWQAENQAAGSGACCVMIKRWLYHEAYGTDSQPVMDSIAFSACVTHREVVFHVHHYSMADERIYMSRFAAFQTLDQVEGCNNIVSNIFKHGLGPRQVQTREQIELLSPIPPHWKRARSARVTESPSPPGDDSG